MIDGGSMLVGAPRWYSLDYTATNEADWEAQFGRGGGPVCLVL